MNERRIHRLEALVKARVAEILQREMADPRLGLITVTRVKLDREMHHCKVYWSVIGDEKERKINERTLRHAAGYVQREIGAVLTTRNTPRVEFEFDESIAGAIRIQNILKGLGLGSPAADTGDAPDGEPPAADR